MTTQLVRHVLYFGIASSLAIVSPALSQIPVTGGRITGDAGFFVPDRGNTVLFDAGTRTLRLETPNGVTVDSRFIPTFGSLNPIGNRLPTTGDTGTLSGLLSGRAFDPAGNPFFFSNAVTNLNFSLNSFVSDSFIRGTLISPISLVAVASTPRAFLPVQGVILNPVSSSNFSTNLGNLYIGAFDANLPSGVINLPPVVRFGTPNNVTEFNVPDIVFRTINPIAFQLVGQGVPNPSSFFDPFFTQSLRYDSSSDPFAFVNFNIQIEGIPLGIAGSGQATVIEITNSAGFFNNYNGFFGTVGFNVVGRGTGTIFDLSTNFSPGVGLEPNSVGFRGNSNAAFEFRDSFNQFITGQGNLTGFNILGVFPVVSSFSSFPGLTAPTFNTVDISNLGDNLGAAPVIPPSNLLAGVNSGTSTGNSPGSTTSGFNPSTTYIPAFNPSSFSSSPSTLYTMEGGVVASGVGSTPVAYAPVGLPSRLIPGFGGWEPIDTSVANGSSNQVLSKLLSGGNLNLEDTINLSSAIGNVLADTNQLIAEASVEAQRQSAIRAQLPIEEQIASLNRRNRSMEALTNAFVTQKNSEINDKKRRNDQAQKNAERIEINNAWYAERGLNAPIFAP